MASLCALLEGVGEFDQGWFAEGATHKGHTDRGLENKACGNVDGRITSQGCGPSTRAQGVVAVDQVDRPGWAGSRHYQSIELELVHDCIYAFLSREAVV